MPLVTTTEMFKKAYDGGYAIGAFNVNNMEIVQGITEAAKEVNAPLILQVSKGARAYANHTYLIKLVEAAIIETGLPICLHLDHGDSFEICKCCIDGGFTSVMIDASSKPFAENIALTQPGGGVRPRPRRGGGGRAGRSGRHRGRREGLRRGVPLHPPRGGGGVRQQDRLRLPGHRHRHQPRRLQVHRRPVHPQREGRAGSAARCASTSWRRWSKRLPGFPIVLHGSSSVPQEYVKMINENGGKMPDAVGIPEEQLRQAARSAVCKINIDSDLRLAMTGTIRQFFNEHPDKFDPREYLKPARANIKELVKHKLINVLGCDGKA